MKRMWNEKIGRRPHLEFGGMFCSVRGIVPFLPNELELRKPHYASCVIAFNGKHSSGC
jgi:hypothetical protein